MSDLKVDDGKQAIRCLEHLLYAVPVSELHNVAATLAQESGQSVSKFASAVGYWTFEVLERFLLDRGMKCTRACLDGVWQLDSLHFLQKCLGIFLGAFFWTFKKEKCVVAETIPKVVG